MRKLAFSIFITIGKPFLGTNITRFRPVKRIYEFLYRRLRPGKPIIIKGEGNKIYVDFSVLSSTPSYMFGDKYKRLTRELFKGLIKPGMRVIDLGAHIGYFTLLAARLVGKQGKVFAFEPAPNTYALLTRNIALNGYKNIVPVQKAVSNKMGQVRLFLSGYDSMFHSIYGHNDSGEESIWVDVVSLDEFFEDKDIPVDFIKMDVEGAETAALEGMDKLIKRSPNLTIITEFSPEFLTRAGSSPEAFLNKIMGYGLKIYIIHDQEERLEPCSVASLTDRYGGGGLADLLCVKGENANAIRRLFKSFFSKESTALK